MAADDIRSVFVGSTVKDLEEHRNEVQSCLRKVAIAAFLSNKDWQQPFCVVDQTCRAELRRADAYIGIFAHWHGWVPQGEAMSITCLEFEWAFHHWGGQPTPRMAVFMPEGDASDELKAVADRILESEFPDPELRREQIERHARFIARICGMGRIVNKFDSISELGKRVLAVVDAWRRGLIQALREQIGATMPQRRVTPVELGRLGRSRQEDCLKSVLAAAGHRPEVASVALLLTGPKRFGHSHCLDALLAHQRLKRARRCQPTTDVFDIAALVRRVADGCGVAGALDAGASVEVLANALHKILAVQSLTLVIQRLDRLDGGVAAFHAGFWAPLHARLRALRGGSRSAYQLFVVVTHIGDEPPPDDAAAAPDPASGAFDPDRLVRLPTLTAITEVDVERWLDDIGAPTDPPDWRADVIRRALTDEDGDRDDVPAAVHDRLSSREFWPEEETS